MAKRKRHLGARFLQKITDLISSAIRRKYRKFVTERNIQTSHGVIRIIEFGFEEDTISPLFIDLHGSGFVLQRADVDTPINLKIREKANIKIASIDYPLAPQFPYPIANEVVYEISKYYFEHASELHIDSSKIGIGGYSAGGTITAATCIKANVEKSLAFAFQVLVFPAADLTIDVHQRPKFPLALPPWLMKMFNDCYIENDLEKAKSPFISPIFATKEQLTGQPPALLIVAGKDSLHDEAIRYGARLESCGVEVETHDFKDSIHGFTQFGKKDSLEAIEVISTYINQILHL